MLPGLVLALTVSAIDALGRAMTAALGRPAYVSVGMVVETK